MFVTIILLYSRGLALDGGGSDSLCFRVDRYFLSGGQFGSGKRSPRISPDT